MNCHASVPGARRDRNWWDSGQVQPPEPGGPDPIWRGLLIGVAVSMLVVGGIVAVVVFGGGA